MTVDNEPIFFQQLDGNAALRSRRGNGEARFHVLDDLEGGAANRNNFSSWFWRALAAGLDFFAGAAAALRVSAWLSLFQPSLPGPGAAAAAGWPFPSSSSKYARHDSSTSEGSL